MLLIQSVYGTSREVADRLMLVMSLECRPTGAWQVRGSPEGRGQGHEVGVEAGLQGLGRGHERLAGTHRVRKQR